MQHAALLHQALWSPYLTEVLEHFCNGQELHRIFGWYNPKELSLQKNNRSPLLHMSPLLSGKKEKVNSTTVNKS